MIKVLCLVRWLTKLISCAVVGDLALLDSNRGGQNVDGSTQRKWLDTVLFMFEDRSSSEALT